MNNYALSPSFSWGRDCSIRSPKKKRIRERDGERGDEPKSRLIDIDWKKLPVVLRRGRRKRREEGGKGEERRRRIPMDTGRISRINGPRRSTKETQCRTLSIAMRLLTRRSLISIPTGPVERLNSKKRDGWRHYERLRIVTVLDPQSAFSC